jgi:AAA+ ATPase superfamily predicted ATPase
LIFDERPKWRREDLFDREAELRDLLANLDRPLVLITGVRRIGKTSVMNVALSESGLNYVVIDLRGLKQNYSRRDLYSLLSRALSSRLDKLKEALSRVRGVSIMGNYVELAWKGRDYVSLSDLFDALNERRLIIALDEAQRLRGPLANEVKEAIAHAYDYCRNLTFVLTGSEVGLLYDFLGAEDSESPLYGRYYHEVRLERFPREVSAEFLRRGFEELGVKVDEGVINEIVNYFDGVPGWLTFAGLAYSRGAKLEEVKRVAVEVARNEIVSLLESRGIPGKTRKRYENALKCIAEGKRSWSELVKCMETKEGSTISPSVVYNVLSNLERLSLVKDYEFLDPVYLEAARTL